MNFSSAVDAYIGNIPEQEQMLWETLRQIILEQSPKIVEEIKYRIPFYSYKGMLCYLNPNKAGGVVLGLCRGNQLSNEQGLLVASDRKMIRHIIINSVEEAEQLPLPEVLQEALMVNELISEGKLNKR